MKRYVPCTISVLAVILAGAITANGQRNYNDQSLDLIRFLATEPWTGAHRWDRAPRFDDMDYKGLWAPVPTAEQMDGLDEEIKVASTKRSAVATALNGRRRRQPTSPLGKAVTSYVGVGLLNNLGSFITEFRENVENLGYLSPQQRATLFQDPPTVVRAPSSGGGGGGGGVGMRRLHALRPLRPTGNIRTYNRRSFVEPEAVYPGANHHDPGLLWTGLGR